MRARGGMGSVARCLIPSLAAPDRQISCRVIDSYGPGHFYLMPFYYLSALTQIIWHGLFKTADVAHIHMSHRGSVLRKLILVRIAFRLKLPALLHIHGSEFEVYANSLPPARRQRLMTGIAKASRIAVLGTKMRDFLVHKLGIDAAKISLIPNGVPLPALREDSSVSDPCRIAALGIMSDRKGTPELLQALASDKIRNLQWTALIAGNGEVDRFRALAAKLGLSHRIEMPGWIDPGKAQKYLAAADIFVLPSRNEGLPMAILEAMAAGIAVVATPVGEIPDLVLEGKTGFLVPPGNAEALADSLATLISDPAKRRLFGQRGRARVEAHFGLEQCAQYVIRLYIEMAYEQKTRVYSSTSRKT